MKFLGYWNEARTSRLVSFFEFVISKLENDGFKEREVYSRSSLQKSLRLQESSSAIKLVYSSGFGAEVRLYEEPSHLRAGTQGFGSGEFRNRPAPRGN